MKQVIVGICGRLVKDGAQDINLLVHSYYVGRPSPCVVFEDWVNKGLIGGHIESVEQIFRQQVATHPGYVVKERQDLVAVVAKVGEPESESETTSPRPAAEQQSV
jgi:hypothetical protein